MQSWTEEQSAWLEHVQSGAGSTRLRSRAGTGKTSVLVEGARLVAPGSRIAAVAFNKSIATTLTQRVGRRDVDCRTTHSLGWDICRQAQGRDAQLDEDAYWLEAIRRRGDALRECPIPALKKAMSLFKSSGTAPGAENAAELLETALLTSGFCPKKSQMDAVLRDGLELLRWMLEAGYTCFDDMIWRPVANGWGLPQFDVLFVDEAQDLTAAQVALVKRSLVRRGSLHAIGDDRQAIYLWRGAALNALEALGEGGTLFPMTLSFRCPRAVTEVASAFVPDFRTALDTAGEVTLVRPADAQASWSVGDFVLSRTNGPLLRLALGTLARGCEAAILGRDIGAALRTLIEKRFHAQTTSDLRNSVQKWYEEERGGGRAHNAAWMDYVQDMRDCLLALADGCVSVGDLLQKIDKLFTDKDSRGRVTFSTVHRAKGLEATRVWVLRDTFRGGSTPERRLENANLLYVAATRARSSLLVVTDFCAARRPCTVADYARGDEVLDGDDVSSPQEQPAT